MKVSKKFVISYLILGVLTWLIPIYIGWILISPNSIFGFIGFIIFVLALAVILHILGFLILLKIFKMKKKKKK